MTYTTEVRVKPTELPDFQCAAYRRQAPTWRYLDDVYAGADAWTHRDESGMVFPTTKTPAYLPKEPKENDANYIDRLQRSPFQDKFAQAVRDFVGILFLNGVEFHNVPPIILQHWGNLDNKGTNGKLFLMNLATAAMRRGHVFALIDCPSHQGELLTIADVQQRRPYWVEVSPLDVLNWRSINWHGTQTVTQATIRQSLTVAAGKYGEEQIDSYLRLVPGGYEQSTISKEKQELILSAGTYGVIRGDRVDPLPFIPLVPIYGGAKPNPGAVFESIPPLKSLADLNVAQYQINSDHRNKMHRCCFPQAVMMGSMDDEELVLGPNTVVQLPSGGAFSWIEPRADSLTHSRQELIDIDVAMDFLSAQYLIKPSDRQAAMVSLIQASKVESSLYQFAESFIGGVNQCLDIHAKYLGLPSGGTISLQTKFFQQQQSDPNLLVGYTNLFAQLEALPPDRRDALLQLLTIKGFIPKGE